VNYPNRKVITLVEWEALQEEGKETEPKAELEGDEEESQDEYLAKLDEGEMLVLRQVLRNQRSERDEQIENIFHSRCTVQGKVCYLIIDCGS